MAPAADDLSPLRRTLGDLLASHRTVAGLTQQQLADRIGYARVTVATAESGHRQPAAEFWSRCEDELRTGGDLDRAYQQLATARARRRRDLIAREQAGRTARAATRRPTSMTTSAPIPATSASATTPAVAASVYQRPAGAVGLPIRDDSDRRPPLYDAPVREVIDYLEQQWHVLVRADNLLGPVHALAAVQGQVLLIEQLLRGGGGGSQARLWRLGAQYAESAAWLYEDLGDKARAVGWTSRALEWAHAADDRAMVSWALFRRSQQAAADRDVAGTLALAQAAARDPARLTGPMRAAIVQQHAQGLALAGDERGSLARLDEALAFASPTDAAGDAAHGHGSFCTTGYLEMQRANCWLLLSFPDRAAPAYQQALAGLPEAYRRDRGHGLARLGRALAATGEVDEAAVCSMEALRIGAGAGSGRIVSEVRQVVRQLGAHTGVPAVAALAEAVGRLGPAA